ncbi:uncharacterized protein LOC120357300 [Solenopsis invicta]|uniref:uncharacterized protein LOC120357300 n=1 Tax=Solenopsis invicta TaxID=13686 RepID=UPI00193D8AAA|nr:uncharacterized protein LOC120357300 [Solenopsis invicta]
MPIIVSLDKLADIQKEDEELQDLLSSNSSLQLRTLILTGSTSPIYCDCSSELIRLYVPKPLRKRIFDVVHGLAHPSGRSTAKQLLQKFIWPSLKKDIKEWTPSYTHWVARYGPPLTITTDQGSQFEAALFKALINLIGCDRKRTSAYHPASNSILERWHRTVKTSIMCHQTKNWLESLPSVLLGLRSCFKEDLKASPADLLYGTTLRIPGKFFIEEDFPADPKIFLEKHRIHMRNVRSSPTSQHIKKSPFVHKNLFDCTHVWIRDDAVKKSLQPPYSGLFLVVKRISDYLFSINVSGKIANISTERLKPAFLPREDFSAVFISSPCSSSTEPATSLDVPASISVPVSRPLRTYPAKKKVHFAT